MDKRIEHAWCEHRNTVVDLTMPVGSRVTLTATIPLDGCGLGQCDERQARRVRRRPEIGSLELPKDSLTTGPGSPDEASHLRLPKLGDDLFGPVLLFSRHRFFPSAFFHRLPFSINRWTHLKGLVNPIFR